jgi:hypothetical protein
MVTASRISSAVSALVMVAAAVVFFGACSKEQDCKTGCTRLIDLAHKEIDKKPIPDSLKKTLREQSEQSKQADIETCVGKCKRGEVDGSCLTKIETFDGASACKK